MRSLAVCLILSQCLALDALAETPRRRREALPEKAGAGLMEQFAKCDGAVKQMGSQINKGESCENRASVRAAGARRNDRTITDLSGTSSTASRAPASVEPPAKIVYPTTTIKDAGDRDLRVSVLSPEQAQAIHQKMATLDENLHLKNPESGCRARATRYAIAMDGLGIESGKVWTQPGLILGSLKPRLNESTQRYDKEWNYHVAPFVVVKGSDGKTEPYVIDPSIHAAGPLPLEKYKARLSSRPNWIAVDFSSRYVYAKEERFRQKADYGNSGTLAKSELATLGNDIRTGKRNGVVIDRQD